ncbi:hypothetical protein MRB53_022487 [Persea americana]|uniref:Uncharacterized protein n=1 Tax=Persea americana TaxID=3435 RepID=A0ACC2L6V5_PERAE|nr:hypothetical protein MRB53_022487 [Persea americana]
MPVPKKDGFADQMELRVLEKYKKAIQFIEDVTSDAEEVQKSVLSEILTQNGHVEYLQRHRLDGRTNQESFKRLLTCC